MLGDFVDEYTVKVVDVFAMPQSGTGVSVEAVDPVFQTKMLEMLKQVRLQGCTVLMLFTVGLRSGWTKSAARRSRVPDDSVTAGCRWAGPRWW